MSRALLVAALAIVVVAAVAYGVAEQETLPERLVATE
jgi:hypothetical protein